MKIYKITCDDSYLAMPSNAHVVDSEYIEGSTVITVEVSSNYSRFEQTLDTSRSVISYESYNVEEDAE